MPDPAACPEITIVPNQNSLIALNGHQGVWVY